MLYVLVKTTINNVFVMVVNKKRKVLFVKTPGALGFSGSKRKTPYAAEVLGRRVILVLAKKKVRKIEIVIRSPLSKIIKSVIKGLRSNSKIKLIGICEKISLAHNGLRARKPRRV